MKHNPMATANALATVGGILYVICAGWVMVSRNSFMGMMGTWAHGVRLSALPTNQPDLGTLVVGFITFVLAAWLTGYVFANVYNSFLGKR